MSERLGKNQRNLLAALGGVTMAMVTGDRLTQTLVRRGLLATADGEGFIHITSRGLRVLADEVDAGRVALFDPQKLKCER